MPDNVLPEVVYIVVPYTHMAVNTTRALIAPYLLRKSQLKGFFILVLAFVPSCFSQNMLLLGGDYNQMIKPETFNVGLGFNIKLNEISFFHT